MWFVSFDLINNGLTIGLSLGQNYLFFSRPMTSAVSIQETWLNMVMMMTSPLFIFVYLENTATVPSKLLLYCILPKAKVSKRFVSVSSMGVIVSQVMMETLHGQVKF